MVLGADEIGFVREADGWAVSEVSNQSTGYCPDIGSWSEVARALDDAGLGRPSGFTHEVVFRRCPGCQEHNIVRENDFVCVFCDSDLPEVWNVDPPVGRPGSTSRSRLPTAVRGSIDGSSGGEGMSLWR